MDRRTFLIGASAALAGCDRLGDASRRFLSGVGFYEPPPVVLRPGMAQGHALRDDARLPPPDGELRTDVAILGSGAAGLSAAWQLARAGKRDFIVIDGPEFGGNTAAGQFGDLGFPRGAHYLPLPSAESTHMREMLADVGVIEQDPFSARPRFDERAVVHAPEERHFRNGRWHDGLLPNDGLEADERAQHARFFSHINELRDTRGNDGRRVFTIPLALASRDPKWTALDRRTFRQWLLNEGFTSSTLHAYADYCCRDDYGAGHDVVSAWAGLHYFASRGGHAQNAADGAVLTWSDGLHGLVSKLTARISALAGRPDWHRPGMALKVEESRDGVEVLCTGMADANGVPRTVRLRARRVICAMPLHVAAHLMPLARFGFDATRHLPPHAAWLVSSFRLRGFPAEAPGVPLAWDNVVHGSRALGYVVATHQMIRQAPPPRTVFTAYCPLDRAALGHSAAPGEVRRWLAEATPGDLMDYAVTDLREVYGRGFWRHADRVEITARGHAMASPLPGFLTNAGAAALRALDGPIQFAHADLSGLSVFEEAAWWGTRAATRMVG
ncbi:NAD(P)-binding protein [Cupriavidus pinatubonensis]|uniref:NAD(P)-binding protein n=1 Tax=Cupriavidus pinatubonensis TaxID=248026 RepID=UPI001C735C10|nr:NAD(P)/FAD-dependent oxidoreductase [Cupriavidus pinatubonensis]QYY31497.1 NAD(P)-binding protein [Cupriavidus pinatubonensis]